MPIGYALSSEEHTPRDLVANAVRAEEVGFEFAGISDHFHPWVDAQGHSPFVWSVIGAIAHATTRLRLGTGVTCPTVRTHPAIIAHAAATAADMMPGRFFLGLGSGEALNEHIFGDPWPRPAARLEMLEEAIEIIRLLWEGGEKSFEGKHYLVENARLYTLPETAPPIVVAAAGENAAELAARAADGVMTTSPDPSVLEAYKKTGGSGPSYAQVTVCWAADEADARKTAYAVWPNAAIKGQLSQDLPTPKHFEQAAEMVDEDDVAKAVTCGPDPERHVAAIREHLDAGYENVYVHQVGRDQEGFFRFYENEVLPRLGGA